MFFNNSYIVEKPEQPSFNDLLPASRLVNSGQKLNKQRPNRTAKPASHLVNSGLSCLKKSQEEQQQFTQLLSTEKSYSINIIIYLENVLNFHVHSTDIFIKVKLRLYN